jgi:hypothetical protein
MLRDYIINGKKQNGEKSSIEFLSIVEIPSSLEAKRQATKARRFLGRALLISPK